MRAPLGVSDLHSFMAAKVDICATFDQISSLSLSLTHSLSLSLTLTLTLSHSHSPFWPPEAFCESNSFPSTNSAQSFSFLKKTDVAFSKTAFKLRTAFLPTFALM